ncbi:MAG: 2Fe-2S iron-sulfur cluster binding domain-containing protein [Bdellovibrionia bacterium]
MASMRPLLPGLQGSTELAELNDDLVYIGDVSKKLEYLTQATVNDPVNIQLGETTVAYSVGSGETILDTLLDAGVDSPFSCKSGICMSCLAVVEEGCVVQDEAAALSDEDISECKALMCQSRPSSSRVRIRFLD